VCQNQLRNKYKETKTYQHLEAQELQNKIIMEVQLCKNQKLHYYKVKWVNLNLHNQTINFREVFKPKVIITEQHKTCATNPYWQRETNLWVTLFKDILYKSRNRNRKRMKTKQKKAKIKKYNLKPKIVLIIASKTNLQLSKQSWVKIRVRVTK
jgi:hypothetical protein